VETQDDQRACYTLRALLMRGGAPARYRGLFGAAVLAVMVMSAGAEVAQAHALLERSEPGAGTVVGTDSPLRQVSLWFSEPVSVAFNAISVLDADDRRVDGIDAHASSTDPTRVDVSLIDLTQGAYVVHWQATSADNHVVRGSYWFAVGFAAAPPPGALATSEAPSVPPLEVAGRTLVLAAALGLAGAAFLAPLVMRAIQTSVSVAAFADKAVLSRQRLVCLALAGVLFLGQVLWAAAQAESLAGVPVPRALSGGVPALVLFGSGFGVLWWLRLTLGLLLTFVLVVTLPRDNPSRWAAVALACVLVVSVSLGSHAAAARTLPILATSVDVIHLLAASVWLGGLLQLACLLPLALQAAPGARTGLLRLLVPRVSTIALASVAVLIATGLFSAWEQVATFQALFSTPYGQSLLVKIGVLLFLLATAAVNLLYVRPRVAAGRSIPSGVLARVFHRLVLTEVLIGAGVLLAVGVLSTLPPPGQASLPTATEATRQSGDLRLTLNVDPNWVGVSHFRLTLTDVQGNPPADVQNVVYTFAMQGMNMGRTTVFAAPMGGGVYEATGFYVGMPGVSQVGVSVSRSGAQDESGVFLIDVPDLNHNQFDGLRASLGVGLLGLLGLAVAVVACLAAVAWRRGPLHPGTIAAAAGGLLLVGGGVFVADSSGAVSAADSAAVVIPAGVAVPSHGQPLFEEHCAVCHGETGVGNGPAAVSLLPPPSDLTLHARWHPDEQLYWFITNGVTGTAMPAWSEQLSPTDRRDVVAYLHELANAPTATPLVAPSLRAAPTPTIAAVVVGAPTRAAVRSTQAPTTAPVRVADSTTGAVTSPIAGLTGRLAFGPDTDGNLWVWRFPEQKPEKLTTFGPGEYSSNPVWSPDRSQIAFSYYKLPRNASIPIPDGTDLYLANSDGSQPRLLAPHDVRGVALQFPAWAPDGKSVYVSYRDLGGTEAHIDRVDVESGKRTLVVPNAGFPTISADGRRLAYATSPAAGPPRGGTTLMWSSPDGEYPHLVLGPQIFVKFYGLRLSPDGQRLLFAAIGAGNNYVPPQAGVLRALGMLGKLFDTPVAHADGEIYDLWTIGLDGRNLQRITTLGEDLPIGAWSPDSRQIAFLGGGSATIAQSGVAVLNADGTQLRRLTGIPGHRGLDWSLTP
jgi:copper transport protein